MHKLVPNTALIVQLAAALLQCQSAKSSHLTLNCAILASDSAKTLLLRCPADHDSGHTFFSRLPNQNVASVATFFNQISPEDTRLLSGRSGPVPDHFWSRKSGSFGRPHLSPIKPDQARPSPTKPDQASATRCRG